MRYYLIALIIFSTNFSAFSKNSNYWESAIQAFEQRDLVHLPVKNSILFVGSSTIRMWELEKFFPKKDYINRGFGGSQYYDLIHFHERIIVKYKPKGVVLYSGDNDLDYGKSVAQVLSDIKKLVDLLKTKTKAHLFIISVKPSPARAHISSKVARLNSYLEELSTTERRVSYIDTASLMLSDTGDLRSELYMRDRLHLSNYAYLLWAKEINKNLTLVFPEE